ncbi:hypothetical protein J6TS2_47300 [Heyndrickxia sporothermodurans]|nr:hypothetical protein J6TS2_47300 [Heyndrickxia sporothermodurans]
MAAFLFFGESIILDVVNKALKNEVTYYDNHSAKIFDSIETTINITGGEQKVETNNKL